MEGFTIMHFYDTGLADVIGYTKHGRELWVKSGKPSKVFRYLHISCQREKSIFPSEFIPN